VKTGVSFVILILLSVFALPVFAEVEPLISIKTDRSAYSQGDTIVISGKVKTVISGTPVTLQFFSQSNLIDIAQITVAQDGNYSHTVITKGPLWTKTGEYVIKALYGEGNIVETKFSFSPTSSASFLTDMFEVDAGSSGTFDVRYTIIGGVVKNMAINPNMFALIATIDSTDRGSISLEIPRESLDAKENNKDQKFIVLIDEIEVPYQETTTESDKRTIKINFEEGDLEIKIIGTTIVPEFGEITIMILLIGIMTTIGITRNKFNLHIKVL
jgi:predicted secreted protein with PEFG-CTERM motif